jgi:hypothetical protein
MYAMSGIAGKLASGDVRVPAIARSNTGDSKSKWQSIEGW